MNCANKYAIIDAAIILHAFWKTLLQVLSLTIESGIALNWLPSQRNNKTNIEATKPEKTTIFAFFCPYNSDIKSVTKKVSGYGKIPAETIKTLNPKSTVTNLFAIKLHVTSEDIKIAQRKI